MGKRCRTLLCLVTLMAFFDASLVSGEESSTSCMAAAGSYATTIAACSTAVACWVLDPATLGLGTWACVAASLACFASIPADAVNGSACLDWLNDQVRLTCEAQGGYPIWDSYTETYLCQPPFEGSPPAYEGPENQLPPEDGGWSGGGGGGGGGWG